MLKVRLEQPVTEANKKMKKDRKFCPLTFIERKNNVMKCKRDECAWYLPDEYRNRCAVLYLADIETAFQALLRLAQYIYERERM